MRFRGGPAYYPLVYYRAASQAADSGCARLPALGANEQEAIVIDLESNLYPSPLT